MSDNEEIVVKIEFDEDDEDEHAENTIRQLLLQNNDDLHYEHSEVLAATSKAPTKRPSKTDETVFQPPTNTVPENDSIVELQVGDEVFKINMNISQWFESHKNELVIKKRKLNTADDAGNSNTTQQTASTTPKIPHKQAKSTMTDRSTVTASATAFKDLSPADRSLKAFFDSMLRATQRLPLFHQGRIKGDLVKALRNQDVNIKD